MKKLVGGDYLLDLTPIDIEESVDGETKTNITNKDVIAQLTNLKHYIRNPEMIKPVWILFNNGETDEKIVVRGQLSVVDTGEFEVCAFINGYKLRLFIEFTQVLNADSQPLDDWYIDTNDAKYLFTSDEQNIGAIIGDGNIPNAKPIYCHPVFLTDGGINFNIQMLIFDNNPTPYTLETITVKIDALITAGAIIQVTGWYKDANGKYNDVYNIRVLGESKVMFYFNYDNGYNSLSWTGVLEVLTGCLDGVNKIN